MNLYGIFLVIGLIFGSIFFIKLAKKYQLYSDNLIDKLCWIVLSGLVGARLTYLILYPGQFHTTYEMLALWQGGLVSFGGILAGLIAAAVVFHGSNRNLMLDLLAPSFMLGWFFGRIGGFLTKNTQGVVSPLFGPPFGNRVPITIFEALLALIIFFDSLWLLRFFSFQLKSTTLYGITFWLALTQYAFGRFIIDFWREDPDQLFGLKLGQLTSLIIFLCSLSVTIFLVAKSSVQPIRKV